MAKKRFFALPFLPLAAVVVVIIVLSVEATIKNKFSLSVCRCWINRLLIALKDSFAVLEKRHSWKVSHVSLFKHTRWNYVTERARIQSRSGLNSCRPNFLFCCFFFRKLEAKKKFVPLRRAKRVVVKHNANWTRAKSLCAKNSFI